MNVHSHQYIKAISALEAPWLKDFDNPKLEWRRLFSEVLGNLFLVLVAAGSSGRHAFAPRCPAASSVDEWLSKAAVYWRRAGLACVSCLGMCAPVALSAHHPSAGMCISDRAHTVVRFLEGLGGTLTIEKNFLLLQSRRSRGAAHGRQLPTGLGSENGSSGALVRSETPTGCGTRRAVR